MQDFTETCRNFEKFAEINKNILPANKRVIIDAFMQTNHIGDYDVRVMLETHYDAHKKEFEKRSEVDEWIR